MKITRCKYGHYYDKAYFRECPHCCRARGGRDEDIIIGKNELSTDLSGKNRLPGRNVRINQLQDDSNYGQGSNRDISQKEQDRKKAERWIGEVWDELENVAKESPKTKVTEKAAQREKQEDRQGKITEEKKRKAEEIYDEIVLEAKNEANTIIERAKVEINREREKVEYQLKKEAIDLALELSTKVIEKNIDKEKNKELIDEFITEVGN